MYGLRPNDVVPVLHSSHGDAMHATSAPQLSEVSNRVSLMLLLSVVRAVHDVAICVLSLIHISEPTRQAEISYAVFCLKKKK